MGRKKTPRYTEEESPNLRPHQAPRIDDDNADMPAQNLDEPAQAGLGREQPANMGQEPPAQQGQVPPAQQGQAPPMQHGPAPPAAPMPPPASPTTDQILAELVRMMGVQQTAIQASNAQMQAFMLQQAQLQQAMYEQQARANNQKQKANPSRFYGRPDEDLELWLFHIEEHFAMYPDLRASDDSRFVDMVVPFLGTDVMSWYREFKFSLSDSPRTWTLFKEQIRARFRDSDFEYKLLTKMYELQPTGSQQEYTTKFMQYLSMSSLDLCDQAKRWFYQQNLRPDTSAYVSQDIPEDLQKTIEYAQRFEDSRKSSSPKPAQSTASATPARKDGRGQFNHNKPPGGRPGGQPAGPAPPLPPAAASSASSFTPTCRKCGALGHKVPDCPTRGTGASQKN